MKETLKTFGFSFDEIMVFIKNGTKVSREEWTKLGQWVCLGNGGTISSDHFWNEHTKEFAEKNGGKAEVLPYFIFKTHDGKIQMGWVPSQRDMLSNDWLILN